VGLIIAAVVLVLAGSAFAVAALPRRKLSNVRPPAPSSTTRSPP
jgi:hypothetical protein